MPREDELDHVLDRRVFHVQIEHGLLAEQPRGYACCVCFRDPKRVPLALRGCVAEHASLTAGHVEQAGEHLECRRLAGAVREEEAHDLARRDLERDAVDGSHLARPPPDEALRRRLEALVPLGDVEDLEQPLEVYRRVHQPLRLSFPCRFA